MTSVAVYTNAPVGPKMSSAGIRYRHFAEELGREFEVTLVRAPAGARELARFDVVVAQHLPPTTALRLARSRTRVVFDLYIPYLTENLASLAVAGDRRAALLGRAAVLQQRVALATGDAFVCASERQRDLWIGALATLGRLDFETYRSSQDLRAVIDVVPFGVPAQPPARVDGAVKGKLPGVEAGDRVLLWGGGIVNWLDPETPIRAVEKLGRPEVKLVFMAAHGPDGRESEAARRARSLARSLGVLDRSVIFNEDWVPYDSRAAYLLDADIAVSAHFDSVETRFAYRTRLLDHFWAGLPTVTTLGDVLGELVNERGLGRAVGYRDVNGWARALAELLDHSAERERIRANVAAVAAEHAWPRVVAPLVRLTRERSRYTHALRAAVVATAAEGALRTRLHAARQRS